MNRRSFLSHLSLATGAVVLMPAVSACGGAQTGNTSPTSQRSLATPPLTLAPSWDAVAYNRDRGNEGFIPATYLADINGPTGATDHLGKHLPWVPDTNGAAVPEGFLAIMWGDPAKGHAKHPNAVRSEANNFEGHWYNWIRVRKATDDAAEELESSYSEWPGIAESDNGAYAVYGGGEITEDAGKNTIYLAALPADVRSGDTVRVWAHCLTHGEYVDFLVVP
jgi:hypothetical protein